MPAMSSGEKRDVGGGKEMAVESGTQAHIASVEKCSRREVVGPGGTFHPHPSLLSRDFRRGVFSSCPVVSTAHRQVTNTNTRIRTRCCSSNTGSAAHEHRGRWQKRGLFGRVAFSASLSPQSI
jgi:hypothetical protein